MMKAGRKDWNCCCYFVSHCPQACAQVGDYTLLLTPPPSSAGVLGMSARILSGFPQPAAPASTTSNGTAEEGEGTPWNAAAAAAAAAWQGAVDMSPDQLLYEHLLVGGARHLHCDALVMNSCH
jgi:hypothetical protein